LGDTPENEVSLGAVIEGDDNLTEFKIKNDYSKLFIGVPKGGN
jgi:hypothetical protein